MTNPSETLYRPTKFFFFCLIFLAVFSLGSYYSDILISVWGLVVILITLWAITDLILLARCKLTSIQYHLDKPVVAHKIFRLDFSFKTQAPQEASYRIQAIASDNFKTDTLEATMDEPYPPEIGAHWMVTPLKRGDCLWPGVNVIWKGRLHLFEKWVFTPTETIKVYPRLFQDKNSQLNPNLLLQQLGLKTIRRHKADQEFESLRPYEMGDDFRHIDWKASARMTDLITRQYQVEHHHNILICIDNSRLMGTLSQGRSKLDIAIEACLHLAYVSKRFEDKMGVVVFNNKIQRWLSPRNYPIETLLKSLYNIETQNVEANFFEVCTTMMLRQKKRSLVIFLSDFLDTASIEPCMGVFSQLNKRHCTLFIGVEDPVYQKYLNPTNPDQKESLEDVNAQTLTRTIVTLDSFRRRQMVFSQLRLLGLHAISVTPQNLISKTLETYRNIKIQGAI